MSKIGKKPISIPDGVEVKVSGNAVEVKGKKGALTLPVLSYVTVQVADKEIKCDSTTTHKQARANWGTMASLLANAVQGVKDGFSKVLEIEGVGFRASMEGKNLVLSVGFTHPVKYEPPAGVEIKTEKNVITVSGIDKAMVGEVAAQIRRIKKPEPYKGKGIHYRGEYIRRKAGKRVAGTTA